jgi:hypothetical protein
MECPNIIPMDKVAQLKGKIIEDFEIFRGKQSYSKSLSVWLHVPQK